MKINSSDSRVQNVNLLTNKKILKWGILSMFFNVKFVLHCSFKILTNSDQCSLLTIQ